MFAVNVNLNLYLRDCMHCATATHLHDFRKLYECRQVFLIEYVACARTSVRIRSSRASSEACNTNQLHILFFSFPNCCSCNIRGSVTIVGTICPLLYTQVPRCPWLASVTLIDKEKRVYCPSVPESKNQFCSLELLPTDGCGLTGIRIDFQMIGVTAFLLCHSGAPDSL